MTAVDVDALDAARAAAAEWMRTHLFWGLDPSKAPVAADMLFALPEFAELLAEVRRGRALRERLEGLAAEWCDIPDPSYRFSDAARRIRDALAAVDPS